MFKKIVFFAMISARLLPAQMMVKNTTGDTLMYVTAQGKIGLGNTDPTAELDVSGTIRIRAGAVEGGVLSSSADGTAAWTGFAGDVTGPAQQLTTSGLGGTPVSDAAPANGQLLEWNAGRQEWQPADNTPGENGIGEIIAGTGLTGGGTGDVTLAALNNEALWNANALQSRPVSDIAPQPGQLLSFDGTTWGPGDAPADPVWNAGLLQGTDLSMDPAPVSGNFLRYGSTTFSPFASAEDPVWNAGFIRGTPVSPNPPSGNAILEFNGNEWIAEHSPADAYWNAHFLRDRPINAGTPQPGDFLSYDGAQWQSTPYLLFNANKLQNVPVATGPFTAGGLFGWDNQSWVTLPGQNVPQWNAGFLKDIPVDAQPPLENAILQFDGTHWTTQYTPEDPVFNGLSILGAPIDTPSFQDGDLVVYNGAQYAPVNSPSSPVWDAAMLQGSAISTDAPNGGDILKFQSGEWRPAADMVTQLQNKVRQNQLLIEQLEEKISHLQKRQQER